jgi:hypothetical protein
MISDVSFFLGIKGLCFPVTKWNTCYYKRDENSEMAGYEWDANGAKVLCKVRGSAF